MDVNPDQHIENCYIATLNGLSVTKVMMAPLQTKSVREKISNLILIHFYLSRLKRLTEYRKCGRAPVDKRESPRIPRLKTCFGFLTVGCGLEQKTVYFLMIPFTLVGGSQDTNTTESDAAAAFTPAGGPGTGRTTGCS